MAHRACCCVFCCQDPVTGLGTPNAARMEAYISQLMDTVIARRQAREAAQSATVSGAGAPRLFTHQRPTVARSSTAWPTAPRTAAKSAAAASVVNAGSVQPAQVWQGLQPTGVAFQSNDTIFVALASGTIIEVNPETQVIGRNYTYDSALQLSGLASSRNDAYLLLLDQLYGNVYIDRVNVRDGRHISRITLGYPTNLGGVDAKGTTVLTSALGSAAVLFDVTSGARRSLLFNASWQLAAAALNPANMDVWLVNNVNGSLSIVVLAGGSNSTRFTVPLSADVAVIGSVSIDMSGQDAYVLYVSLHNTTVTFVIEQFSATDGRSVRKMVLPSNAQPMQFIAAGGRSGEVYWINGAVVTVTSGEGRASTLMLGKYPSISSPSDVAVTASGNVLVAQNLPFQIVEFNATGGVVEAFPLVDEFASCQEVPFVNVAVDAYDNVLMPICNSTILVFDRRARVAERLYTGNHSVPRAVAAGPRGSILFTDDNDATRMKQIARNGSIERTWTSPFNTSLLLTVHWDNASQSAWAVDLVNGLVLQWPIAEPSPAKAWNLTAIYGRGMRPWAAVVDRVHQQLIVTADSTDDPLSAWVLWLSLGSQQPLYNFSFPVNAEIPEAAATGVAVSSDGSRVYATDMIAGAVYVFNTDQLRGEAAEPERVERIAPRASAPARPTTLRRTRRRESVARD